MKDRPGKYMEGNAGVVATTAGNDLLHTLSLGRSLYVTKIIGYNNTGGGVTFELGTLDRNPAGAAFVPLLTTRLFINGLSNEWMENEIPMAEWISWSQVTAAGRTGDVYVLASAALVDVQIEVYEMF